MQKKIINYLIIIVAVIWILPIVWMFSNSIKFESEINNIPPIWFTFNLTITHYIKVLTSSNLLRWLLNSIIISVSITIIILVLDSLAAYSFARINFWGKNVLFSIVIASMMVPQQVRMVPLFSFISELGLVNSNGGVILPMAAVAFGVFLLRQFFLGIPKELEEAALIDGCNRLGILFKIYIPLAKSGLTALAIFTLLGSWNNFLWPLIILQNEQKMTLPIGLANMQGTYSTSSYGILMAAAVISSLPILIMFTILKNKVIEGITLTSGIK